MKAMILFSKLLILILLYISINLNNIYAQCVNIISVPDTIIAGNKISISGTVASGFGARPVVIFLATSKCSTTWNANNMVCANADLTFSTYMTIPNSLTPGTYFINGFISTVTACNGVPIGCGCISSESKLITIISPDDVVDKMQSNFNEINVFPNPFDEELNIQLYLNNEQPYEIKFFNVLGIEIHLKNELIFSSKFLNIKFNTSVLEHGVYFIKIKFNSKIITKNFIKH